MTVSKPKVLVIEIDNIDQHAEEYKKFADDFEVEIYALESREKFAQLIQTKYNDISAIWCLWVGFAKIGGLNKELIPLLPETLKVISIASIGYDQYDAVALGKRGIILTNAPGLAATPVADLALHLSLSVFRFTSGFELALRTTAHTIKARESIAMLDKTTGMPQYDQPLGRFAWGNDVGSFRTRSPGGHHVGIGGFGSIGKVIGKRLSDIGMKVHYTKRSPLSEQEIAELGYEATYHDSFDELFKHSELLVLALPLTPETRNIVNEESIKLLPDGARIVNVGRGGLVDQKALVAALKSGKISAAGLDVYEQEPFVEPELLQRYDVTLVPHLGSATFEVLEESQSLCVANIRAVLETGKALNPVN